MSKIDHAALVNRCRENLRAGRPVKDGLSKSEQKALLTRYARFEDTQEADGLMSASEVLVTALRPPRPYLHMMTSNHVGLRKTWGSFWDGTRGGFCCLDSVQAGKMSSHLDTNYVPTSPEPQDVRQFFIHEDGKAWPMFPVPGVEENRYSKFACRQGLDQISFSAVRAGLAAKLVVHVPTDWPAEVWEFTIENQSDKPRSFSWFAHLRVDINSYPFYYFVPRVVCEGIIEEGAMVFINHDQNNKHPRQAMLASDQPFDGYDMMSEVFDGWSPRAPIPAAAARGACFNSPGAQPAAGLVAAAQFNAQLEPGQSKTWRLAYGACYGQGEERRKYITRVRTELLAKSGESRAEIAKAWHDKALSHAIDTPDAALNRYFNVWSKYQARNMSRFCHALDKIGYRDILQHLVGICDFDPKYVRARLAEALHYQFPDGRAVRQYEVFPGSGHDTRMYQDSPVSIPDLLTRYVKETGDFAFLDEQIPFLDAQTLTVSKTESGTVYDHAVRGIKSIYGNTGYHGLCKIGYGDWNDALSRIGGEKGISVWLSCACIHACRTMAGLARHIGKEEDAQTFESVAADLTQRINEHGWDGQWYIYAIDRDGKPIGSHKNKEGSIHLNVNTWAIFTGVAAAGGREEAVWNAINSMATPVGHVLLQPPYTAASRDEVGRIADQMPGQFENGAVYMHGESFFLYALVLAGQSDRWYEEMPKSLPSEAIPDIVTGPPHQQSNYANGPAHQHYGMNPFSNFTGSVSWYRRGVEMITGVMADYGGLRIAPRPPKAWKSYRVTKDFRGSRVNVELKRGKGFSVTLDGQPVTVTGREVLIPAGQLKPGTEHKIEVTY